MSEVSELLSEELRLKIAWSKGYRPLHTVTGAKLMKPGAPSSGFGMPQRNIEAPNWPEDIAAAFRLLGEFKGPADEVALTRQGGQWRCEIRTGGTAVSAQGETPQLAICKAYVLAKGISTDE
ncbi:MAG TPA: hypothetical protein VFF68_08815 [Anaerolineaceae bacterium]|nr:hypothetical protein [Anaerolineaceae bacterium]